MQLISNINACTAVVDTVRTTLGPRGMDKLIYNDKVSFPRVRWARSLWGGRYPTRAPCAPRAPQGQTTISNDGATIMRLLEIVHPAAKTLVDVSLAQDAEVPRI